MIKNVIFDVGKVLVDFCWEEKEVVLIIMK